MDLILWRHAQAEALTLDDASLQAGADGAPVTIRIDPAQDLARCLTPKGHRQAERMAAWLNGHLPDNSRVLVSPAQRTQQTALALGRSFKTVKALNPQATVDDLLKVAKWPQLGDAVVVVGHQPILGMAAARLLTGYDLAWSVKKGAIWWLRLRERQGEQQVTLQTVQSPDWV